MEQAVKQELEVKELDEKSELKLFQKAVLIFLVGQILLMISVFNLTTAINGIPTWFKYLQYLSYATYLMYFITLFLIRWLNKSFRYSFYSLVIFAVVHFTEVICKTSTNQIFMSLGKGLSWSSDVLLCFVYLFFFNGCFMIFNKYQFMTGKKNARIAYITFLTLFILANLAEYLTGTRAVMGNSLARRITLYSYWGLLFSMHVFNLVMVSRASWYINKKMKQREEVNNHEQRKDEELPQ